MKKFYFLLVLLFTVTLAIAQDDTTISILYTADLIEIDGFEEAIWENVDPMPVDKAFTGEEPTVTAYWKMLWDDTYFYVLVAVEDNDHYPAWESGGSWYEYDQVELYFDVNEVLKDGGGPNTDPKPSGHYQIQPPFEDGASGVVKEYEPGVDYRANCTYCYELNGNDYVFEFKIPFSSFTNVDFQTMTDELFKALEKIGFDVTIIDQDEGITSGRQRAVWSNTGENAENYVNMDDAGTIKLVEDGVGISENKIPVFPVYPNPAVNYLTIEADFDRVVIYNGLGQQVRSFESSEKRISLHGLPDGFYFIQAFENERLTGKSKFLKK
ncbi:MAG TPA: T9SS type A sorting domain-containing protein [Bacteroides sp.]|nr:T9SS type A sorting domain-containing protein [Bacteroides sp.]